MNAPAPKKVPNAKLVKAQPLPVHALIKTAVDVARGVSRRRIVAANGTLPVRLVREMQKAGLGEAEFRKLFQRGLEEAAGETLERYRLELRAGRIPPSNLSISLGILTDKVSGLNAKVAVESINIAQMVNYSGPRSREDLLRSLAGESPEPVLALAGHNTQPIPALCPGREPGRA
jgi:hypothetical protein